MYGFSTSRLAASITRLTRVGADAGAITRPSTSVASSGGGGGGSNVAPPVVGLVSADAVPASASRNAAASATKRTISVGRATGGILFRTPAGLADGLALKELARLPEWKVRPSGVYSTLVPPLRVTADSACGEASRCFGVVANS